MLKIIKENALDDMAKYNKKRNKKHAKGWFVKQDAGNVEYNNAHFNHISNGEPMSDGCVGGDSTSCSEAYSSNDLDKAQVKAFKLLTSRQTPYAVIYAYDQGKGKVYLDKPLVKKSQDEVDEFVNSFSTGKQAQQIVAYVFYQSQVNKIRRSLQDRELI